MIKQYVSAVIVILFTTLFSFSQTTFVPDDNFENYLETHDVSGNVVALGSATSMGNGIANDDLVFTNRINTVAILDINGLGISDLTGVDGFSALYELACGTNNLTNLDVSANTALEILAADNQPFLTQLNIANGNNGAMIVLAINNNPNLGCITVDNQTIANNWNSGISLPSAFFSKDPTSSFSADCGGTFVPDNNFENYLETHDTSGNIVAIGAANSMGNGLANDNFVLTNRINSVPSLSINSLGISDLTGIADFSALYELACGTNNLTNLDVSANTALEILVADNQPFLTQLNIANGNNGAMIVLAINNNPNLGCITVDNQTIANNWNSGISLPSAFFNKDPTSSFSADCGGTFVPDNNFENYLETHDALGNVVVIGAANSMGNGLANDNFVITTRINSVTSLFIANLNIEDLTGIEDFISLTSLSCGSNQLTSLDVSAITGLIILSCDDNNLISLDVSANTSLVNLNCGSNQLTSLDVTAITGLITLDCDNNNLTSLDVSANTSLVNLNVCCNVPSLTRLNLANGNNSNMDTILLLLNPNLTCVTVDNQTIADDWNFGSGNSPDIFIIDPQTAFSTNCDTFVPDDNFENYLETHDASGAVVPLGALDSMGNGIANDNFVISNRISSVNTLNITNLNISDLTGIEYFTDLVELNCNQNQLTSLDLSANTNLTLLSCNFNQLTYLDVSTNSAFAFLNCTNNNLTYLNVANGNNLNFFLPFGFNTENNPNLTCIEVDDAVYATGTWGNIDPASSFSEDCGITLVPDDNFENYLETHDASGAVVPLGDPTSMGNGIANDNYVITSSINTVTTLDINTQNIADLSGIEEFTGLTEFRCFNNQLTSIDVSANTELTILYCFVNQLTSLNVSQNTALIDLQCNNNPLGSLDVSANIALTDLWCNSSLISSLDVSANTALNILICSNNSISELDVSQNTALTELWCSNNLISSLDMSPNTALELLVCFGNNLSELDVSQNPVLNTLSFGNNTIPSMDLSQNSALTRLFCPNSQLEFLDVANGNNSNVTDFISASNPNLTCITVDDVAYSNANWSSIDPASAFSADCGSYVPDDNFELYLESHDANGNAVTIGAANSMGNGITNDNFVPTNKINSIIDLNIQSLNIADLTGIEDFTDLQVLNCNFNALTTIDLSQNTALEILRLFSNTLSSLDVSTNTQLIFLDFGINAIESIDLSSNLGITALSCSGNPIVAIDLSMLSNLDQFFANGTPNLTSINLANGNNSAMTGLVLAGSPNLFCVEVDNQTIVDDWNSGLNLPITNFNKDPQTYFSIDCSFNDTPDRAYALNVGFDFADQAQIVDNTNATDSELLDPFIPEITECDGSDGGYNGGDLWYEISIPNDGSVIIETGISGPLSADTVIALYSGTQGNLVRIACNDDFFAENFLSKIILTGQTPNTTIYARVWSYQNDIIPFQISAYRNPAISTYIPDDVFEQALMILGYDAGPMDNHVLTANINTVEVLELFGEPITDLTGIEDFTALTILDCTDSQLTSLDMSGNTALTTLRCGNNQIISLNVTGNVALTTLRCVDNQISSLNLTANTELITLNCSNNLLSSLNLTANTGLITLACSYNQLNELDISNSGTLETLVCSNNELTSLDFSDSGFLKSLDCASNQLNFLNIAGFFSANFTTLFVYNNPDLTCITVNNEAVESDWNAGINLPINGFAKDPQTAFSTNCNEVVIEAKAYLQGAFLNPRVGEGTVMRDDLRAFGHLPPVSPYDATPLTNGDEFDTFGPDAIVDWVYVELRDDIDNSQVIEGQSALLQRDGDIVAPDGISPLVFAYPAKHYNVVVKHRNHSNIITSLRQPFPLNRIQNYTDGSTSVFGANALINMNGTLAMWTGDANNDGLIQFSGGASDVNVLKDFIIAHPTNLFGFLTTTINGYSNQDINMNGQVKFSGSDNDSNVIKDLILGHPGNFLNVPTYTISTQVPQN